MPCIPYLSYLSYIPHISYICNIIATPTIHTIANIHAIHTIPTVHTTHTILSKHAIPDRPYTPYIPNIPQYHTPTTPQGGEGEDLNMGPIPCWGGEGGVAGPGAYIYNVCILYIYIYTVCIYIIEFEVSCCFSVNLPCLISVGSLLQANLTDSEVREWTCLTIYLSQSRLRKTIAENLFNSHQRFLFKKPVVHPNLRSHCNPLQVFQQMHRETVAPDVITYNALLGACTRRADWSSALLWLREVEEVPRLSLRPPFGDGLYMFIPSIHL